MGGMRRREFLQTVAGKMLLMSAAGSLAAGVGCGGGGGSSSGTTTPPTSGGGTIPPIVNPPTGGGGTNPPVTATIAVDVRATYLRTYQDPQATDTVPLRLSDYSVSPGRTITLTQLGAFEATDGTYGGTALPDTSTRMIALFSSSNVLLDASNLHRVSGAIKAGSGVYTDPTFSGNLPTDIDEDFEVLSTGSTIVVPAGATYLFVAARDFRYGDNADPNHDYAVRLDAA